MTSDFPAGLSRSDIHYIMQHDSDVVHLERVDGPAAMWKVSVSVEGADPVHMLADNGINDIYLQVLVQIDADHIVEALRVIQPYATVGLTIMNDALFIRSAFYVSFSNMHALSNTLRATASAYTAYQRAVANDVSIGGR